MSSRSYSSDATLHQVLADYFERLDRGEHVDKASLLAAYPGLADKLLDYFQLEGHFALEKNPIGKPLNGPQDGDQGDGQMTVAHASGNVGPGLDTENIGATIDHTPGRSKGLHIRCPHCSNGVELLADTPFEDITCKVCGSTFNLAVREDRTAVASALKKVGRFELVSRLGIGGFGTVWKARDTELDRVVAIKIPRKGQLSSQELEQFFREARSAAQLRHPNIVPVYEVGKEDDLIFIVCAYVRGISLSDWLTGHKPAFHEVCGICLTIAKALHHAHEHGVIHRDLKPSNVMLDQANVPHLMDFGLAKRDVNEITMTVDGQILGTPAYMSPEQAMGQAHWTDRRTDIYSLGIMLFEMLTGEKPFRGNAQMQVHQRLTEDPPDPRSFNRHIPRDLSTICLKCLERDPNRRYPNCQQIVDEFDRFLKGEPLVARPISKTERLLRWCKRKPALAAAIVLTTVLAVVGPAMAIRINSQRQRLAALVEEKDDLIQQMASEKETSVNRLSSVEGELALLKGEANPWEVWPFDRNLGPKQQLLGEVYKTHYQDMARRLDGDALGQLDRAFGHFGLAILSEQVHAGNEAKRHFEAARDLFATQMAGAADQATVAIPLADCYVALSRLYDTSERAKAEEALRAADEIYERFGRLQPGDLGLQADQMDARMRSAMFAEPEQGRKDLTSSAAQIRNLVEEWPTEPREFYNVISRIVENRSPDVQSSVQKQPSAAGP